MAEFPITFEPISHLQIVHFRLFAVTLTKHERRNVHCIGPSNVLYGIKFKVCEFIYILLPSKTKKTVI